MENIGARLRCVKGVMNKSNLTGMKIKKIEKIEKTCI